MNKITLRALQASFLASGAPLGWLLIQYMGGASLIAELRNNSGLYAYMLFGTQLVFISFSVYLGKKEQLISDLAIRDTLTGIYNLRFIIERLKVEIANTKRHQTPLSIIYLDLDHFKRVNDKYGHPGGDEVLRQVSSIINANVRPEDVFARVGGEEFAILLPRCTYDDAMGNAERVRKLVEQLSIHVEPHPNFNVTISLGVATHKENETLNNFYKRADQNLYLAKDQGRNQVAG